MKAKRNNKNILFTLPLLLIMPVANADWALSLELDNNVDRYVKDKKSALSATLGLGIEYRGVKFNIDKKSISYEFVNLEKYAIEAILQSNNQGFEKGDRDIVAGLSERRDSIDIGVRGTVKTNYGPITLGVTRDLHASKGHGADLRFGGIAPHSPHWTGKRELSVSPLVGVRYQSQKVVDYHYGVKSNEATATRAKYKGVSATTPYIGIESKVSLNKHFELNAGVIYERRHDSIRDSSLTDDKDHDVIGTLGVTYWF